jgi:hypothetical protein
MGAQEVQTKTPPQFDPKEIERQRREKEKMVQDKKTVRK